MKCNRTQTPAFVGVNWALANLTTNLYRLRASQLLGFSQRKDGYHWLLGLLVGALKDYHKDTSLILICTGRLATLHDKAQQHTADQPTIMDAEEASRNGLLKAGRNLWNTKNNKSLSPVSNSLPLSVFWLPFYVAWSPAKLKKRH